MRGEIVGVRETMYEDFKHDDTAASPVIGVVLIVAITVILAAVIGGFVLDTGSSQATTPQADFTFDYNGSAVTVTVTGGETFDAKNSLHLNVETTSGSVARDFDVSNGVDSGDTAVVTGPSSGAEVEVVWFGPEGDKSHVVARWEVP